MKKLEMKKPEMKKEHTDVFAAAKPPISPSKPPLPRSAILSMRKFSADQGLSRGRSMTNAITSRTISAPNLNKPPHQLNQTIAKENSQSPKVSPLSTGHSSRPWRLSLGIRRRSLELSEAPSQPEPVLGLEFTSLKVKKSL